jgi:hypothetical protein
VRLAWLFLEVWKVVLVYLIIVESMGEFALGEVIAHMFQKMDLILQ